MGKKKRDDVELKPFCYYCDKEFKNETILQKHMKNRHFSCQLCRRKFSTAKGLVNHSIQRHRKMLNKVHNAKKGRDSATIEIYKMDGIPQDVIEDRMHQKRIQKAQKMENELKKMGINVDDAKFDIA